MKKKINLAFVLFLSICFFFFISCGNDSNKTANDNSDGEDNQSNQQVETQKSNLELLQGKWQNIEDKTNYLVFENNLRKEIVAGLDEWDEEIFILSDKCQNISDKDNDLEKEKDRYISCEDSDLCWYIIELNSTTLSISYMGRGNTLSYTRVE